MRKFRTTSVAAATALTLTFTGTSVAHADSDKRKGDDEVTISTSSQLGKAWGAYTDSEDGAIIEGEHQVIGTDLLGSSVADDNPEWADNWRDLAYLGIAGTVIGGIIGGINWLKYEGILPR